MLIGVEITNPTVITTFTSNRTRLNLPALAFAAALATMAAFSCTLGPALLLQKRKTAPRLQSAFLFSQAALTVAILVMSALLFTTSMNMWTTSSGSLLLLSFVSQRRHCSSWGIQLEA